MIDKKITGYLVINSEEDSNQYVTKSINDTIFDEIKIKMLEYQVYQKENIQNIVPSINKKLIKIKNKKIMEQKNENFDPNDLINSSTILLVFLFVINYTVIIGQEISSEKGSKVMEIILSSTNTENYLLGKICSVLLMCFTQLLIYLLLFGIMVIVFGKNNGIISVLAQIQFNTMTAQILGVNTIYFILSIISYALLSSMFASLVNRYEDTPKALQPLTFFGLFGFYIGMFIAQNKPDHIISQIVSYIPLLSTYSMPFRLANSTTNMQQVIISITIFSIFAIGLYFLTIRVYKNNILNDKVRKNYLGALLNSVKASLR
ncbi:ABC transporter permease [Ignavigranum ruoffiae]|uniref:ABC transporter permease n=1 Tax=Ignavigranum ruoffiae TaxID=89093 RepID=UPI0024AD489C|nr:ABC transporter permease [Ignavigranum ruoffiae]